MSEQLSGRDLDLAIAAALGRTVKWLDTDTVVYRDTLVVVDHFHADANAVIAVCAARGWSVEFHRDGATIRKWDHEYLRIEREWYERGEPQEAGARALFAAITA